MVMTREVGSYIVLVQHWLQSVSETLCGAMLCYRIHREMSSHQQVIGSVDNTFNYNNAIFNPIYIILQSIIFKK